MNSPSYQNFTRGVIRENPTLVMLLGMCPTLGVTTSALNGLGMGLGFTLSLTCIGLVRELVGGGAIFGHVVIPADFHISIFVIINSFLNHVFDNISFRSIYIFNLI